MSFSQSASQVKVSSRMYLWCGWWSLLIPCNDTSASLMCYASHLVTIFVWARLSSCVFPGSSGSVASAKGYMTEWEGGGVIGCLFSYSNSTRCHSHLYLLRPPFPSSPHYLITKQKGDRGITEGLQVWAQRFMRIYFWCYIILRWNHLGCVCKGSQKEPLYYCFTNVVCIKMCWPWLGPEIQVCVAYRSIFTAVALDLAISSKFFVMDLIYFHCKPKPGIVSHHFKSWSLVTILFICFSFQWGRQTWCRVKYCSGISLLCIRHCRMYNFITA